MTHFEIPGIHWPPVPPRRSAALMAMLYQLEHSQWLSSEQLLAAQFGQLWHLVQHARQSVPFYHDRLQCVAVAKTPEMLRELWSHIPLLTRNEVQASADELTSTRVPQSHGVVHSLLTSGSTGQPLLCKGTQITRFFWHCITLRDHDWHRRDFSQPLAAIRYANGAVPPDGRSYPDWGAPVNLIQHSGPSAILSTDSTVDQQAEWLRLRRPTYLIAYPSNIKALAKRFLQHDWQLPELIQIRSFGEVLEEETRQLCRQAWDAAVVDCYSSQEVGYVALECPDAPESYHVQSETMFVEILDDQGRPSAPGQIGRVVATPLHNAAMPLIRYDLQDFAEVGPACRCGRGLPTLLRIAGRQRNMVTLPDGQQRWPGLGRGEVLARLPPIHQYQIVQTTIDQLEIRFVQPVPFKPAEEQQIRDHICSIFGHPFDVQLRYVDEINRSRNGKFEEFISQL